jgi:chromosome segregation ATPase
MKNRIGAVVLVLVCLGLGVAMISIKREAAKQKTEDIEKIATLSTNWVVTTAKLDEQKQVTTMLEKDMESQKKSFEKSLGELTNNFSKVSADLAKAETTIKTEEEEIKQRDAKISDLESQNQILDKQALKLSSDITNLTAQIADTQHKLAASEGDKAYLEGQLKRLMAEKNELERQFTDLAVLRAQVSKIKEELATARRLEWSRQGLYANAEQKGAQRLLQGLAPAQPKSPPKPVYDLNVEVSADGSVRVVPPSTNTPAAGAPPPVK